MAEPAKVRRLIGQESRQLQRIVRRGSTSTVRCRRTTMLPASADGTRAPVTAPLVQADEDTVVRTATTRPAGLGQPSTRWSIRKPPAPLRRVYGRVIRIGRETLRCLPVRRGVTFQRTRARKESADSGRGAKLGRIEHVLEHFPDRASAFDEFGPHGCYSIGDALAHADSPRFLDDVVQALVAQRTRRDDICVLHISR